MTKNYDKQKLKEFKEMKGGPSPELIEWHKATSKLLRTVREAIAKKNKQTVPEIAKETRYPQHRVFFAINALRKYEGLQIVDKSGAYPKFAFKE